MIDAGAGTDQTDAVELAEQRRVVAEIRRLEVERERLAHAIVLMRAQVGPCCCAFNGDWVEVNPVCPWHAQAVDMDGASPQA